ASRAERLQYGRHFVRKHGDITGDLRIRIGTEERRPGVEAHASIDRGAHFLQVDIVAANRDLVDLTVLLALVPDQLRDLRGIDRPARNAGAAARYGALVLRCAFADLVESRLRHARKIRGFAVSVHVHVEDARVLEEEVIV